MLSNSAHRVCYCDSCTIKRLSTDSKAARILVGGELYQRSRLRTRLSTAKFEENTEKQKSTAKPTRHAYFFSFSFFSSLLVSAPSSLLPDWYAACVTAQDFSWSSEVALFSCSRSESSEAEQARRSSSV